MKLLKLASAVTALFLSAATNAAFISTGTLTMDTDSQWATDSSTNLEWHRWDHTNLSYEQYISSFQAGGIFKGWRIATTSELSTMLSNAGFSQYTPIANDINCNDGSPVTACNRFISTAGSEHVSRDAVSQSDGLVWDTLLTMFASPGGTVGDGRNYLFTMDTESYLNSYGRPMSRFRLDDTTNPSYQNSYYWSGQHFTTELENEYFRAALVRDVSPVPVPAAV